MQIVNELYSRAYKGGKAGKIEEVTLPKIDGKHFFLTLHPDYKAAMNKMLVAQSFESNQEYVENSEGLIFGANVVKGDITKLLNMDQAGQFWRLPSVHEAYGLLHFIEEADRKISDKSKKDKIKGFRDFGLFWAQQENINESVGVVRGLNTEFFSPFFAAKKDIAEQYAGMISVFNKNRRF